MPHSLTDVKYNAYVTTFFLYQQYISLGLDQGVSTDCNSGSTARTKKQPEDPCYGVWGKGMRCRSVHMHVTLGNHSNISKAQATRDGPDGHYFCPESHLGFSKKKIHPSKNIGTARPITFFFFSVHIWRHLCMRSEDKYQKKVHSFSFYFLVFSSRYC